MSSLLLGDPRVHRYLTRRETLTAQTKKPNQPHKTGKLKQLCRLMLLRPTSRQSVAMYESCVQQGVSERRTHLDHYLVRIFGRHGNPKIHTQSSKVEQEAFIYNAVRISDLLAFACNNVEPITHGSYNGDHGIESSMFS
jgi:hypothetical protein